MNFFRLNNLIQKILLSVFIFLFFTFFSEVEAEQSAIQLSFTEGNSFNPQLAVFDNIVYSVWTDNSPGNKDIFFSNSINGGLNFEKPINLSNNNLTSAFPRMAIADDKIFVAWYDYSFGKSEILLARSNDNGFTFETINLSNNAGASYNPWIKAEGKNVYVVWNDESPHLINENIKTPENMDVVLGDLDILIATSHDGGATFDVYNLSNSTDVSWDPRIVLSGNNVYVVWNETTKNSHEIFFSMSTDNGTTFSKPINISISDASSTAAGIQVSGNNIYIIWNESSDIFFSMSDNNGLSFSNPVKLSTTGGQSDITRDTQMAVLDSNIFVVFYDNHVKRGVYLVKSTDKGKSFSEPIRLSDFENSHYAQIANNNDDIYIIWNQISDNSDVFLRTSHDGAQTFGSNEKISNGHEHSNLSVLGPQIAISENKTYIVFESEMQRASDLYLKIIEKEPMLEMGTLLLKTPEETIDILVDLGEDLPDTEKQTSFQIEFIDPDTGSLLENVNYSFEIVDAKGNKVVSNHNQLAYDGKDVQNVQFPKSGSATIKIDVVGTGTPPYETKFAGNTTAVITVVPEFPVSVLGIVFLVISGAIILSKISSYQLKIN